MLGEKYSNCAEFRLLGDRYFVAFSKGAAFQHFAEDAFARHYTVAHLVVDGAMRVAFFADLREFEQYVAGTQARAYGERFQIEPFYDQIFAERPVFNVDSCGFEAFNAFVGKEADLPMPVSGVRIAFDSPIGAQFDLGLLCLLGSFGMACANGFYRTHDVRTFLVVDMPCTTFGMPGANERSA
ncbi:MAG: hypothetical protein U0M72_06575 [Eggerthellaceae bacterium]